jgi:hypothetical protein
MSIQGETIFCVLHIYWPDSFLKEILLLIFFVMHFEVVHNFCDLDSNFSALNKGDL